MKLKITCPQCGKTYKVEADDFKECAFAKCSECGSLIPVDTPAAPPVQTERDDVQKIHIVKLELPEVTDEWIIRLVKAIKRAYFRMMLPYLIATFILLLLLFVLYVILYNKA